MVLWEMIIEAGGRLAFVNALAVLLLKSMDLLAQFL